MGCCAGQEKSVTLPPKKEEPKKIQEKAPEPKPEPKKEEPKKEEPKKEEPKPAPVEVKPEPKPEPKAEEKKEEPAVLTGKQMIFMAGYPGAGKTFLGDYLVTRGWAHIDGDDANYNPASPLLAPMETMWPAMQSALVGGKPAAEEWQPFYKTLISLAQEAAKSNEKVVITFAVLDLFEGAKEYMLSLEPTLKFVEVKVDLDVLKKRFRKRSEEIAEQSGTTIKEMWAGDEMAEARAAMGEEFSDEKFDQYNAQQYFKEDCIQIKPNNKTMFSIPNENFEQFEGIKALNALFGLSWVDVDVEAIKAVQMGRYAQMGGGEEAKAEEPKPEEEPLPDKPQKDYTDVWAQLAAKVPWEKTKDQLEQRKQQWREIDRNGNNYLSFSEIDGYFTRTNPLPAIFDLSPVLMRAFQAGKNKCASRKQYGDEYVEKREYRWLLKYIRMYYEYWVAFDYIDRSGDERIGYNEFVRAKDKLESWGIKMDDPEAAWKEVDVNGGGQVLFYEFCEWAIKKNFDLEEDDDSE